MNGCYKEAISPLHSEIWWTNRENSENYGRPDGGDCAGNEPVGTAGQGGGRHSVRSGHFRVELILVPRGAVRLCRGGSAYQGGIHWREEKGADLLHVVSGWVGRVGLVGLEVAIKRRWVGRIK